MLPWDGPEESIAVLLEHQVFTQEAWLASIDGLDVPPREEVPDAVRLLERHDAVASRWLETVRDIDRRGSWTDRLIDALCDPPESFVMGSVTAHVLTSSAHRRQAGAADAERRWPRGGSRRRSCGCEPSEERR